MSNFNIKVFKDGKVITSQNNRDDILNKYQVQLLELLTMLENEFENIPLYEIQLLFGDRICCTIPEMSNIKREIYL
jgi:hypothetical protein